MTYLILGILWIIGLTCITIYEMIIINNNFIWWGPLITISSMAVPYILGFLTGKSKK